MGAGAESVPAPAEAAALMDAHGVPNWAWLCWVLGACGGDLTPDRPGREEMPGRPARAPRPGEEARRGREGEAVRRDGVRRFVGADCGWDWGCVWGWA